MHCVKTVSMTLASSAMLLVIACAPAAPPTPTAAPPKPAATAPPAKPAEAPKPAAKPTEAPAAKPVEKPAVKESPVAKAAEKAAEKPAEKPAASPAAKPAAPLALTDAEKADVEAFYKGKTLRIIVGFAPGGGYDVFARVTARHISKFIPGNPNVLVENMTGAGSLTAANHVYAAAPKDGTVIATFSPGLVLEHAMAGGGGAYQLDPKQFPWLGSPTVSTNHCQVRVASGGDTLDKLVTSTSEIVFGSTAPNSMSTSAAPSMIRQYLNPRIKVVQGFDGVNTIKAAVERGEVDGTCGTWETFRGTHAEWLKGNPPFARVVLKSREDPLAELKDVPLLSQRLPNDEARQIYGIAAAPDAAGFPYAAPLGTPAPRLKALRIALPQTWNDAEFKAESLKANLVPIPLDYQAIESSVRQITTASPDLLKKAKEALGI